MANSQTKEKYPIYTSKNEEETHALGKSLALNLKKGSIVALYGKLGAGKTCFAKGLALGLGVQDHVKSPTYTIISEYEGRDFPIYHIDAYRLKSSEDFSMMGGEEIIFGEGISIIEWSEIIENLIPEHAIRVYINIMENDERQIQIKKTE